MDKFDILTDDTLKNDLLEIAGKTKQETFTREKTLEEAKIIEETIQSKSKEN